MGDHINADGQFQSDKYPWCRPGFVPLKLTDAGAWQPLWDYAEQRRAVDAGFADDLQAALLAAGYTPPSAAAKASLAGRTIEALLELAYSAYIALEDGGEELADGSCSIDGPHYERLSKALDALDELPDDRPGYTMGPAAKAGWALRGLRHGGALR